MFKKILIANRGEIACRIISTAKKMSIKTVAVYSDADKFAPHVFLADESHYLGESTADKSYLDKEKIIDAMHKTGSEAVHPGYGFLSENASFAKSIEDSGFVFIGPSSEAINLMGDKISSKKIAEKAGVSIVPGFLGEVTSKDHALGLVREIGLPVLIKATAGGGGKGMRVVENEDDLEQALISSQNEAESSFGDKRVFIEKFVTEPRHIEIQIISDKHGNCLYLGERECSIQRRNQKVIEEAPSSFVDSDLRKKMGEQAVKLAKEVEYFSAGTVEFIVDKNKNFYFLEMNTRLQVEHPVTELITGIDLVELMIKVAYGEKLELHQNNVQLKGWALECRIYAEDPFRNFLPSTGRLRTYKPPLNRYEDTLIIRNDSGVDEGGEISMYYDPMISKLCTWCETREKAIILMESALDEYQVEGIGHNIPFLSSVLRNSDFREGKIDTSFIQKFYPDGFEGEKLKKDEFNCLSAIAAFAYQFKEIRNRQVTGKIGSFDKDIPKDLSIKFNNKWSDANVSIDNKEISVSFKDKNISFSSSWTPGQKLLQARFKKNIIVCQIEETESAIVIHYRGSVNEFAICNNYEKDYFQFIKEPEVADTSKFLICPMPGLLVSLSVNEGDVVEEGQVLCSMEAMKMENVFKAEKKAKVKKINAKAGDSLAVDDIILEFD
jgi:propionyl-CoA carboxylase alpha chain